MRKRGSRNGTCKVTFVLAAHDGVDDAHLCGEFNDWSINATPMTRRKDGTFDVTVTLETDRSYRFRLPARRRALGKRLGRRRLRPQQLRGDDSVVAT